MTSRTYIQMLLKLHNENKLPLCKELLHELTKYNTVLENHPEAIEEIVQRRVDLVKYVKKYIPNMIIWQPHYCLFERIILDSMFMAELIEPATFDDFDLKPNLRLTGFEPVMSNAIAFLDEGIDKSFHTPNDPSHTGICNVYKYKWRGYEGMVDSQGNLF